MSERMTKTELRDAERHHDTDRILTITCVKCGAINFPPSAYNDARSKSHVPALVAEVRRLRGLIASWGAGPRVGYGEAMAALEAEAGAIREEEPRNQEALR